MSNAPDKPEAAASQPMWTIRTDKGKTFGPAPMETLLVWARDGRIAPTSEASQDGTSWTPVTALPLDMDWVAEVSPATFYGPIHRNALDELIREGSLAREAPCFQRHGGSTTAMAAMTAEMQVLGQACREAEARAETLEQRITALRRDLDQAHASLKARDHEFDAERQELKAAHNRVQAEVIKMEGRLANLEAENSQLNDSLQKARETQGRITAAERQAGQLQQSLDEAQRREETLRQALRKAEHTIDLQQTQIERERHERETLGRRLSARQEQVDHARQLTQQALNSLTHCNEPEIEDAVVVVEPAAIPPVAPPAGTRAASAVSLAAIEKQAQRELQQIGEKGGVIFKRQARK